MPLWWFLPFVSAVVLSAFCAKALVRFALKYDVLDVPGGERKLHAAPVPLLAGSAIALSFFAVIGGLLVSTDALTSGTIGVREFTGFMLGGMVLLVGGFLDDVYSLHAKRSIIAPVTAALLAVVFGIGFSKLTNPFGGILFIAPVTSAMITFAWLIAMTYTTKLLDGMDGLAASVAGLGALMVMALALTETFFQPDVALAAGVFLASIIGFLWWNMPPAKAYLGEGGSTFLGYALGVLAVISGSKVATLLLVLGVPAIDIAFILVERFRCGQPLWHGDRRHLHLMLRDAGMSDQSALALYLSLCAAFGMSTLFLPSLGKVIALGVLVIVVFAIRSYVAKRKPAC